MMTVPNLKYIAVYSGYLYKTSNIENVVNQLCSSSEMWLAVEWNVTLSLSVKKNVFDCIALALVLVESVLDPPSVQGPPGLSHCSWTAFPELHKPHWRNGEDLIFL